MSDSCKQPIPQAPQGPSGILGFDLRGYPPLIPQITPIRRMPSERDRAAAAAAERDRKQRINAETFVAQGAWSAQRERHGANPVALAVLDLHEPQAGTSFKHVVCSTCLSDENSQEATPDPWPCATFTAVSTAGHEPGTGQCPQAATLPAPPALPYTDEEGHPQVRRSPTGCLIVVHDASGYDELYHWKIVHKTCSLRDRHSHLNWAPGTLLRDDAVSTWLPLSTGADGQSAARQIQEARDAAAKATEDARAELKATRKTITAANQANGKLAEQVGGLRERLSAANQTIHSLRAAGKPRPATVAAARAPSMAAGGPVPAQATYLVGADGNGGREHFVPYAAMNSGVLGAQAVVPCVHTFGEPETTGPGKSGARCTKCSAVLEIDLSRLEEGYRATPYVDWERIVREACNMAYGSVSLLPEVEQKRRELLRSVDALVPGCGISEPAPPRARRTRYSDACHQHANGTWIHRGGQPHTCPVHARG